jgi:hypothetical protein
MSQPFQFWFPFFCNEYPKKLAGSIGATSVPVAKKFLFPVVVENLPRITRVGRL